MRKKILILGGTTEARLLAGQLGLREELDVMLSLAGRTIAPAAQPVPVRTGGFGGAEGLSIYLSEEKIDLLIDATHPYAAQISSNAAQASALTKVPAFALRRAPWTPIKGDKWQSVAGAEEAVEALGKAKRRVFLALGRQEILPFENAPQHIYVVRSVDPIDPPLNVPNVTYILGRGPFVQADEMALLKKHRIEMLVAKNSGGKATSGKIAAARELGIKVFLFERPAASDMRAVSSLTEAVKLADHLLSLA
ncbi:cobalt-precorrin-6A reductase [Mesorhizobium sp. NBSH29]|uniref:cobalt-precorrin-6A reductase n=1 Tax=Mesorhizobium sp. NBSH29 TaxID=2654249 RepID=UPI0018965D09|nr:cobalt-precorrin-6A reductase [Mesorhizobium sp. NBSH29]QPC86651.1 cobalt-precorrin-6A reductase [Mesorhizobium sp. NBSH29]